MAIEAAHYQEARDRLRADPIVIAMAAELRSAPRADWTHADGSPTFAFMQSANAEYRRRGGTDGGHIGAIAEAIGALLGDPDPEHHDA